MAEASFITQLAQQFGAPGLFIGFLIWDRLQMRAERTTESVTKMEYDKDRLDADKALAASLAALTTVIQGLPK